MLNPCKNKLFLFSFVGDISMGTGSRKLSVLDSFDDLRTVIMPDHVMDMLVTKSGLLETPWRSHQNTHRGRQLDRVQARFRSKPASLLSSMRYLVRVGPCLWHAVYLHCFCGGVQVCQNAGPWPSNFLLPAANSRNLLLINKQMVKIIIYPI